MNTSVQSWQRRRDGEVSDRSEKKKGGSVRGKITSDSNWHKPSKSRKYDDAYIALRFTVNMVGNEERPVCVLCLKTLAGQHETILIIR